MRKRGGIMVALALLCATLLAGCGLPLPFPQPTPDLKLPDAQQIFRPLGIGETSGSDVLTLDPAWIFLPSDQQIAQFIFPQLVTLDEQGKPVDWAAERHEISANGLTYTFHLRTGMTWSDGTPIDASTFAYSINRALDPCTQSPTAYYLYPIKGAQAFNTGACPAGAMKSTTSLIGSSLHAPDPLTLQIILQQPAGYFLTALTSPISWGVPQPLIERYGMRSSTPNGYQPAWTDHLADNGGLGGNLYRLVRWDHNGHLDLERNERFWGKKPLLRRIEYMLYNSQAADVAWADFKQGTGDLAEPTLSSSVSNSSDYSAKYAQEVAATRTLKGVKVMPSLLPSVQYLRPNWQIAPFDDVRVRQAFALALDHQALAQETFQDLRQPSIHLVPDGVSGYNPALADAAGRTGKDALSADVRAARQLANSYAAEKCGGSFAACAPVVLLVRSASAMNVAIAQTLQRQWQAAFPGWSITINSGHIWSITEVWRNYVQLLLDGWFVDYPDPQDFLSQLYTSYGEYNRPLLNLPAVDALCAQADASADQPTRLQLYQQAEQLLITQGAAIPFSQAMRTTAVRTRVVGWRVAPTGITPLSVWQQVYIRR